MASINKLSIRGVRSFSPDDQEQVVEFFFPVTIIVGANGCGKTTIIESLKYALSGSLPPGNKSGQAFVHDPRSIGHTVVKANVKLRFTNKAGASMVVIRSMELTQKKTTMQFKQLDGVLRTVDQRTGERKSLSHKCSELDKQIPSLMGVSKAILDYVLFVHQEDSNWPLQEAAVLKKRFDDIFDSARYSKALDTFRKTKKDLQMKVKDYKAEVAEYRSHKHAASTFHREIEEQNRTLDEVDQEIKECEYEMEQAKKERDEAATIVNKTRDLEERLKERQSQLRNIEQGVARQRSMLEEDLTQKFSLRELKDMLRDFDKEIKKKKERQNDLQLECREIEEEIEELRNKEMNLNSSKGKYEAEKAAQEKRLRDRIQQMESLAKNYDVELQQSMTQHSRLDASLTMSQDGSFAAGSGSQEPNALELSRDDMDAFFNTVDKKEEELKENLRSHKASYREQDNEIGSALSDLKGRRSAVENEMKKIANEQEEIQLELKKLAKDAGPKKIKKSVIDDLKEAVKKKQSELDALSSKDNREQMNAEIRSCMEKIERIKGDIESKTSVRQNLQSTAMLGERIKLLKDQSKKDLEGLQESLEKETPSLRSDFNIQVPNELPDDSDELLTVIDTIYNGITTHHEKTKRKLAKANDIAAKLRHGVSQESASIQSQKQNLASLKKQQESLEQRGVKEIRRVVEEMKNNDFVRDYTIDEDPQFLIDFLEQQIKKIEEDSPEEIPADALAKTMKRLRKLAKKQDKRQCPCCCRGFNEEEQRVFTENMKQLADSQTSPLVRGDNEDVKKYRVMKSKLEDWRSTVYSSMTDLNNFHRIDKELRELEPHVSTAEAQLKQSQTELAETEKQVSELQEEETKHSSFVEKSRRWLDDAKRFAEQQDNINVKVDQLRAETADSFGETDLETVDEELNALRAEKDELSERVNRLNKEVTNLNQNITAASQRVSNTRELLQQRQDKYNQEQAATERTRKLNERKHAISQETTSLGEQITSLQSKIKAKESEKNRLNSHASDEEYKLNTLLQSFQTEVKYLRDLTKLIDDYDSENKENKLERISADVAKILETIKGKKQQLESLQPELDDAIKAVNDQQRHETLLQHNIDLLEYHSQIEDVEKDIAGIEEELDKVEGRDSAAENFRKANKRHEENSSRKAGLGGRRQAIVEQIRGLNRKLQSSEYRDVDKQYREALIKQETTQMAVSDLDKYANALDKALLRFHEVKLGEINKIIRELWVLSYKGEDITNIEIVSGQEKAAAKSYNYRVVMTKGTSKMDMRGRCSAGQRVLASLVIRLALAETFGVSFGCLVLDEPTVNLDYHNKQGLATALSQIIAERAQQSNFQLVLITHDEDFVTMMKGEMSSQSGFSMPEKYFQVRREEGADLKYYSKVDAVDWDELL